VGVLHFGSGWRVRPSMSLTVNATITIVAPENYDAGEASRYKIWHRSQAGELWESIAGDVIDGEFVTSVGQTGEFMLGRDVDALPDVLGWDSGDVAMIDSGIMDLGGGFDGGGFDGASLPDYGAGDRGVVDYGIRPDLGPLPDLGVADVPLFDGSGGDMGRLDFGALPDGGSQGPADVRLPDVVFPDAPPLPDIGQARDYGGSNYDFGSMPDNGWQPVDVEGPRDAIDWGDVRPSGDTPILDLGRTDTSLRNDGAEYITDGGVVNLDATYGDASDVLILGDARNVDAWVTGDARNVDAWVTGDAQDLDVFTTHDVQMLDVVTGDAQNLDVYSIRDVQMLDVVTGDAVNLDVYSIQDVQMLDVVTGDVTNVDVYTTGDVQMLDVVTGDVENLDTFAGSDVWQNLDVWTEGEAGPLGDAYVADVWSGDVSTLDVSSVDMGVADGGVGLVNHGDGGASYLECEPNGTCANQAETCIQNLVNPNEWYCAIACRTDHQATCTNEQPNSCCVATNGQGIQGHCRQPAECP
jgi:hypothetical protein